MMPLMSPLPLTCCLLPRQVSPNPELRGFTVTGANALPQVGRVDGSGGVLPPASLLWCAALAQSPPWLPIHPAAHQAAHPLAAC